MEKATDNKSLAGSDIPFPWTSEIGSRLTMGDICHYDLGKRKTDAELGTDKTGKQIKFDHLNPDHYNVVPKMNKLGKIPNKTSWDSFSYALMMAHNVNSHITSVQRANQLMDIEIANTQGKINWRQWRAVKANDSSFDQYSDWVPRNILYFANFIEDLFNTKTKAEAFEMIEDGITFLRALEGTRSQDGKARNTFFNLFETEEVTLDKGVSPVFATPELDEDKLLDLEEEIVGE